MIPRNSRLPSPSSPQQPPTRPWWGLGDVALGIVAALLLSTVISVAAYAAAGWSSKALPPLWAVALLQVPLWLGLLGAVLWASRHKGLGLRDDFGWSMRWTDPLLGVAVGVAMQLLVIPLLYIPLLSLLGQSAEDLEAPARKLADRATGPASWLLLVVIVAVGAPVVEELFYRGLFLASLEKRGLGPWPAALVSAVVFGAMHFEALQFAGLFLFGLVLALMVQRTGRLGPAIWAHAAFNAATVVSLYLQRAH